MLGNTAKQRQNGRAPKRPRSRIHPLELTMGMYMLHCAYIDVYYGKDQFYIYLILQAAAFFTVGFSLVGTSPS
ncbi:hypothetical protein DM860_006377 [Cuscuta australis]|uniref:Uncharacterized protein n=1 Tax=Cuscuta australis TaxID=267555 RepID=A0A328D3C4_9ASTE|nr:hypothetical protein DM860_006377 [Cuscuta australis]